MPSRVMRCEPPADPPGREQEQRRPAPAPSSVSRHSSTAMAMRVVTRVMTLDDDRAERAGERPLGADDVVVQAADQGAGLRAGEEGDRHALHVVEQPDAQVEDEALADPRRPTTARPASSAPSDDGDGDHEERRGGDESRGRRRRDRGVVDDAPDEQRRDEPEDGLDDDRGEEPGEHRRYGRARPQTRRTSPSRSAAPRTLLGSCPRSMWGAIRTGAKGYVRVAKTAPSGRAPSGRAPSGDVHEGWVVRRWC